MKDLRMYILVNKDITPKLNIGKAMGQSGHAVAVYFYHNFNGKGSNPLIDEYMTIAQKKIILYCSQKKLEELELQGYITIRDKGWTDLEPNTLTCVNLGIIDYNNIPDELIFIKKLQLMR